MSAVVIPFTTAELAALRTLLHGVTRLLDDVPPLDLPMCHLHRHALIQWRQDYPHEDRGDYQTRCETIARQCPACAKEKP